MASTGIDALETMVGELVNRSLRNEREYKNRCLNCKATFQSDVSESLCSSCSRMFWAECFICGNPISALSEVPSCLKCFKELVEPSEYITPQVAAKKLGLDPEKNYRPSLMRLRKAGHLKVYGRKNSNDPLYKLSEVIECIELKRQGVI